MTLLDKIKELLEDDTNLVNDFFYSDIYDSDDFKETGIGVAKVASHGGEDEGSDYYSVYGFTKDDETVFIQFQGWYASYHGAEFEEYFEVEPKETTITVYNRKQ